MLSPEQIALRKKLLGGSDMNIIMSNKPDAPVRRMNLWMEKIDHPDYQPENFDDNWDVQMGNVTEAKHIEFVEKKYGPTSRHGHSVLAFEPEWAAITLDGWLDDHKVPLECKWSHSPYEVVVERNQPQIQWTMMCTEARECAFSVIIAGRPPIVEFVPRVDEYIKEALLPRATAFWQCVRDKVPPVEFAKVIPPPLKVIEYDMSEHVVWKKAASLWLQTFGAAQTAKEQEKILKELVPEDAKMAYGCGVRISRDRADRLSLREWKP